MTALDTLRLALLTITALAQAVMGIWPQWRRWDHTVPERSEAQHLPIVPWPPFFTIWAPIFLASFAFVGWSALPANHTDPLLRTLGWLAIAAWTCNAAWEWHVPGHGIDGTSQALIVAALVALLAAMAVIAGAPAREGPAFWCGVAPLQLLAGWISAATFVNLGSAWKRRAGAVGEGAQLALLLGAGTLGTAVAWATGSLVYAGAVAWALAGIVVGNVVRDRRPAILAAAALLAPLAPLAAWLG